MAGHGHTAAGNWTEKTAGDAVKRYLEGETASTVGKRYGVSRNAIIGLVHRYAKRENVVLPHRSPQKRSRAPDRAQPPVTPADLKLIKDGAEAGDTPFQIAAFLGLTAFQVKQALAKKLDMRTVNKSRNVPRSPPPARFRTEPSLPMVVGGHLLEDLPFRGACKFAITPDHAKVHFFCSAPADDGPYCDAHRSVCYQPKRETVR